jgi:hypothetical protein
MDENKNGITARRIIAWLNKKNLDFHGGVF